MIRKLLCAALLCAGLASAQTPPGAALTPNFQNTDIGVVANAVTEATGINFILDPSASTRKITLANRRPMSGQQFYDTFLSILQTQGFVALPAGNRTMKIVQEANARTLPGSELTASTGPDELVHIVIPVKNINAQQVATVLNQLRSSYGVVQAVPGTNSIIVTDRAANVRRMRQIIESVDQTSGGELDVLVLQYATAADVVRTLTQLIGTQQQANASAGIAPRITADTRTNSVLVLGEPAHRLQVAAWVSSLDTPLAQGGGEPEVVYLKFGDAETLAPLLKEFATGIAQAEAVAAAGGVPAGGGAAAPAPTASSSATDRSTTILAEPSTNALIVTAPPKMMRELKAIIGRLDVPRAQVFIEAIIAEVSTDKASDLGVNWGLFQNDDGQIIPGGGFIAPAGGASIVDLGAIAANPSSLVSGNVPVPLGGTFGLGRLSENGVSWAAVIRALRTDSESNVIAEPKLLALDNEESVFQDGQTVPFLSGLTTSFGGGGGQGGQGGAGNFFAPTQDIDRQDIGTKLTITPQINDGGAMTLDIQLESSELSGATGDAGSPITNKRSFDTKVRVDDGQTIVLAGMIRNFERKNETRVPFLGRIPLIGELFKVRGGQRQQKMLMVFIRPRILLDSLQADAETQSKYNLIRERQIKQGSKFELIPLLPGESTPVLPQLDQPANPIQPPPAGGATTSPVP